MTKKIKSVVSDVFLHFIKSCENFLDFLVYEHSFSKGTPSISPPECWIEYKSKNIALDVIYEYDDFPWIRLTVNGRDYSLDSYMRKYWHERPINRKEGPSDPNAKVDFALNLYSIILKKHVAKLLK